MPSAEDLSYCGEQVRRFDRERFLTLLYAPAERREALFAVHAFNIEIAKTREVVSEALLGQMRLQWWRDSIAELYEGQPKAHEVLKPLGEAVQTHGLSRAHFETLLSAREADLEEGAPPDLPALERYAAGTAAPLIRLSLEVLGVRDGPAHEAAEKVGTAWALTGLIRAVPFHARQRRVFLPTAVVEEVAADMGELFELRPHAGLAKAVERLAAAARGHLQAGRALGTRVPAAATPALLLAVLAHGHLKTLRRARHDVFDPAVQRLGVRQQLSLMAKGLLGRY
ncbi:MAG: squalene/phytoene synthase family protein [Alphaproteobacteria bacterium]|jgi:phytoene synthase|nr:squalene/phytoene synthase family protein [Alphaproteobacteria bacterium]